MCSLSNTHGLMPIYQEEITILGTRVGGMNYFGIVQCVIIRLRRWPMILLLFSERLFRSNIMLADNDRRSANAGEFSVVPGR